MFKFQPKTCHVLPVVVNNYLSVTPSFDRLVPTDPQIIYLLDCADVSRMCVYLTIHECNIR